MTDQRAEEVEMEQDALDIVKHGRAYTKEHYPVGSPGKFVGRYPADEFDAAVDALVEEVERLRAWRKQFDVPLDLADAIAEREEWKALAALQHEAMNRLYETGQSDLAIAAANAYEQVSERSACRG